MTIAQVLHYTVDEVLDKNLDWINVMLDEINRKDLEDKLFQLSLHGVDKKDVDKIRRDFERQSSGEPKDIRIPLTDFQQMGISLGRPNATRVIRDTKEKK